MIVSAMRYSLWAVLCASLTSLPGSVATTTLRGTVVDAEGAVITMAHIVVHADGTGRASPVTSADLTLASDKRGQFSLSLEPGFYDVCLMAQAFTPQCRKVLLQDGETTSIRVRLEIDKQVINGVVDKYFGVKK